MNDAEQKTKTCPTCGFKVKSGNPLEHGIGFSCGIGEKNKEEYPLLQLNNDGSISKPTHPVDDAKGSFKHVQKLVKEGKISDNAAAFAVAIGAKPDPVDIEHDIENSGVDIASPVDGELQNQVIQFQKDTLAEWDNPAGRNVDMIKLAERFTKEIAAHLQAAVREAEERGVAWSIGVIDEFHFMPHEASVDRDKFYKGVKNGLRDRYRSETGIDPAPNYPVNVKLNQGDQNEDV